MTKRDYYEVLGVGKSASADFAGFCRDLFGSQRIEAIYYTTKIKQPSQKIPLKLSKMIAKISGANRNWIAQLTNQKIAFLLAGGFQSHA